MSADQQGRVMAVVPAVDLDELINVMATLESWLLGAEPQVLRDLDCHLGQPWGVEEFISYIETVCAAVESHYQPAYPFTEW